MNIAKTKRIIATLALVVGIGAAGSAQAVSASPASRPAVVAQAVAPQTGIARPMAYTSCSHTTYAYNPGGVTVWATKAACLGGTGSGYKAWQVCSNGGHAGYQYGDTQFPPSNSYTNVPNPPCYGVVTSSGIIIL